MDLQQHLSSLPPLNEEDESGTSSAITDGGCSPTFAEPEFSADENRVERFGKEVETVPHLIGGMDDFEERYESNMDLSMLSAWDGNKATIAFASTSTTDGLLWGQERDQIDVLSDDDEGAIPRILPKPCDNDEAKIRKKESRRSKLKKVVSFRFGNHHRHSSSSSSAMLTTASKSCASDWSVASDSASSASSDSLAPSSSHEDEQYDCGRVTEERQDVNDESNAPASNRRGEVNALVSGLSKTFKRWTKGHQNQHQVCPL